MIEELGGMEGVLCSLVKILFSVFYKTEEKASTIRKIKECNLNSIDFEKSKRFK